MRKLFRQPWLAVSLITALICSSCPPVVFTGYAQSSEAGQETATSGDAAEEEGQEHKNRGEDESKEDNVADSEEEEVISGSTAVVIATFSDLDETVCNQSYSLGELTAGEEPELPKLLYGYDDSDMSITVPVVEWEISDGLIFDPDTVGTYIYTPVIDEQWSLADDVELPAITVQVTMGIMLLSSSTEVIDLSDSDPELSAAANASEGRFSYDDTAKIVTILSGPLTVTGSTTERQVQINGIVDITLDNLDINVSAVSNAGAFLLQAGADATITLVGDSSLKSGHGKAGIQAPAGTRLTIEAENESQSLTTVAGENAAGIGGGWSMTGGNITINGGTVNTSSPYGAGIGGGRDNPGGTTTINGGVVNARGGVHSAGIGGSYNGNGGTILITGGIVNATKGSNSVGIGGGLMGGGGNLTITGGSVNPVGGIGPGIMGSKGDVIITGGSVKNGIDANLSDGKGNSVYRCILTGQDGVTSVSVDAVPFWIDSNHDGDDDLYLYLTGEDHHIDVEIGGTTITSYKAVWNSSGSTFTVTSGSSPIPEATSVSLDLSQNPVAYGTAAVTVTATVTDDSIGRPRSLNAVDFYFDGSAVSFASAAVIAGTATTALDTSLLEMGDYEVKAVYGGSYGGTASSDTVTLIICKVPSVGSITAPAAVDAGGILSLTVPAVTENNADITTQGWEISADGITGWTAFDPLTSVTYADNQKHLRYIAVNAAGTGSSVNTVQITVNPIVDAETPVITVQPQGGIFNQGASSVVTITASVTDGGVLSYQWYKNTTDNVTEGVPVGADSSSYSPDTSTTGTLYYYCVVTNINTAVNGLQTAAITSATAAVTVNPIVDAETPVITVQPQGGTFNQGSSPVVTITAGVTDGGVLSYQWYKNTTDNVTGGVPVGTDSSSYSPDTGITGTLYYYCVVTNTNTAVNGVQTAAITSAAAAVTVNPLVDAQTPVIVDQPQGGTFKWRDSAVITVNAKVTDEGVLSWQWYENTTDSLTGAIPVGTDSSSYSPDTGTAGTLYYYCIITNTNTSVNGIQTAAVTSHIATVKVETGGSSSGESSSSDDDNVILPTWTIRYGKLTDKSTTAAKNMTDKPDAVSDLNMQITKQMVTEGVEQAKKRWGGREQHGISLAFENQAENVKGLNVILESDAIDGLMEQGVKSVTVQSGIIRFKLDEAAIKSLKSQAVGHVTVTVTPHQVFGAAAEAIGTRPVYEVIFRDSTGKQITGFGEGLVTLGIAYKTTDINGSSLIAVQVKNDNDVEWLADSYYDNGWLVFNRRSHSVYGVAFRRDN